MRQRAAITLALSLLAMNPGYSRELEAPQPRAVAPILLAASQMAPGDEYWQGGYIITPYPDNNTVYDMVVDSDGDVYICRICYPIPGQQVGSVDKLTGSGWINLGNTLGAYINGYVVNLSIDAGDNVYTTGLTRGDSMTSVSKWDGYSWSELGTGLKGNITALVDDAEDIIYAGGQFFGVMPLPAPSCVAMWDGSNWMFLGELSGYPAVLAIGPDGYLYAGGEIYLGSENVGIVRWDGSGWQTLGSGLNNSVRAIAFDQNENLYVAGRNLSAGGSTSVGIAKWDGNSWSALTGTPDGGYSIISTLTFGRDGVLYAGGSFSAIGGVQAANVAKWDGNSWSALGSGVDEWVLNLARNANGMLYASGRFTSAGGVSTDHFAAWDAPYYTLTITKAGSGSGIVTGSLGRLDCGDTCSAQISLGSIVTLTATPDEGSCFAGWSGAVSDTSSTIQVTMDAAKDVTATFDVIPAIHSIILPAGWRLVSSYVAPANPALPSLTASLAPHLTIMKNGKGLVYWPALNINQIGNWNIQHGYQLYVTEPDTFLVEGDLISPELTPIALAVGWNMSAFLRSSAMPIATALDGIAGHLVIAKNGSGKVYWPAFGINTIGSMQPGEGYQIYVNKPSNLTYPANETKAIRAAIPMAPASPATILYAGFRSNTSDNATLLISAPGLPDGAEIGARTAGAFLISAGIVRQG